MDKKPLTPTTLRELKAAEGLEVSSNTFYGKGNIQRRIKTALNAVAPFLTEEERNTATKFYAGCFSVALIGRQTASYEWSGGSGKTGSKEPYFDQDGALDMHLAGHALKSMRGLPIHLKAAIELIAAAEPQSGKNKSLVDWSRDVIPSMRCEKKGRGGSTMAIKMTLEFIEEAMRVEKNRIAIQKIRAQKAHEAQQKAEALRITNRPSVTRAIDIKV